MASTEVALPTSRVRMASDTLGTGTRTALLVSFPLSDGIAFAAAEPAPVSVITIFNGAERPRRVFLW